MINCPKCGFFQPKDDYCANCGVNMMSFKAKPVPFFKSIWSKSSTQSTLFVVLVIALSAVIYFGNLKNKIVKSLSSEPTYKVSKVAIDEDSQNDKDSEYQDETSQSIKATQFNREASQQTTEAFADKPTTTARALAPNKLRLSFYEASIDLIKNKLSEDIDDSIKLSKFTPTLLSDFTKENSNELHKLPGQTTSAMVEGKVISLNHRVSISGYDDPVGLFIEITPKKVGHILINLKISGQVNIPNRDEALNNFEFDTQVTLFTNEVGFIINFLLPESFDEKTLKLLEGTPLSILESPDFIQNNSTILLFIEPTT